MRKYFTILFLTETASFSEVKKSYRKLAKQYHPDKNSGSEEFTEKFRNIQEAYEKLSDHFKYKKQSSQSSSNSNNSNSTKTNSTKKDSKTHQSTNTKQKVEEEDDFDETFESFFEEETEEQNKVVVTRSMGDNINVGYFEYNVINAEFSKVVGGSFVKTEADGIYLMIELKVTNKTNIQRRLHNYMFRLSNTENDFFEYSAKGLPTIAMNGIKCIDIFGKDFNPKIPTTVNLIFEVPEKDIFFLNLCGGEYEWDENTICHCKEIEVVKII